MPEDEKKNPSKKPNKTSDPKDQRKPRAGRGHGPSVADTRGSKKETKVPVKPPTVEPGPEFYSNLKRETDEILKISEEAQSKYSKKEISSNWQKYEIPIDSYDDIEQQENMGADYEKLIQTPMSAASYFQFKHEKSWDSANTTSEYDKYFEINNDVLAMALSSIAFYQRNCIDTSIFSENDLMSMKNRATKYKQKYYNDRTFTTAELDAERRILEKITSKSNSDVDKTESKSLTDVTEKSKEKNTDLDIDLLNCEVGKIKLDERLITALPSQIDNKEDKLNIDLLLNQTDVVEETIKDISCHVPATSGDNTNAVIDSEEDLEKWLDDFLDK